MTILYAILFLAAAANLLTGLVIFVRNTKDAINRYFFVLSIAVAGWIGTNVLFRVLNTNHARYWDALISYGFASLLAISFYIFSIVLVRQVYKENKSIAVSLIIFGAMMGCVAMIPGGVARSVHGLTIVANNLALGVYGLSIIALLSRYVVVLLRGRKHYRLQERNRITVIIASFIGAAVVGTTFNLFLPMTGNYSYVVLGPAGSLIFVAGTAYAIIKHRLFDIRIIIARVFAYMLAVIALAAIYSLIVFNLASLVFGLRFSTKVLVVLSVIMISVALSFGYIKKFFARLTNKIFFQDMYDPQLFLDELNRSLVSSIELEKLLKTCSLVISDNLKAEYCAFGLLVKGNDTMQIFGSTKSSFSQSTVGEIRRTIYGLSAQTVVIDNLASDENSLKRFLLKNDIAVLTRLAPEISTKRIDQDEFGCIILGQKRTGNSYTSQDIQMLGIIANELVIAVQNSLHFEEIQRFNVTLQEQVNEATHRLRQTNQKLLELDEAKDDFISMASHQLRTPLTSVKGYISMVLDGDAGRINRQQAKMLRQAFSSSQRMVYLITDLLNISRLKTGKFIIDASPTDLSELAHEEVSGLQEAAKLKDIKLTYQRPAAFPKLMLDEVKTRQVVMNFIDNALYYTPTGGHIRIELEEKPAAVELRVVDDGIGVPKSEQHHLFTKFYRAGNARKVRPDGTGLGLFMAKKVIAAQGGSIVFSSREDHGSVFGFVFSKSRLQVPDQQHSKIGVRSNSK